MTIEISKKNRHNIKLMVIIQFIYFTTNFVQIGLFNAFYLHQTKESAEHNVALLHETRY